MLPKKHRTSHPYDASNPHPPPHPSAIPLVPIPPSIMMKKNSELIPTIPVKMEENSTIESKEISCMIPQDFDTPSSSLSPSSSSSSSSIPIELQIQNVKMGTNVYEILSSMNLGMTKIDALNSINDIFEANHHPIRKIIYQSFCKKSESTDIHRQCNFHGRLPTPNSYRTFSYNGSSSGTSIESSRMRLQCKKCRLQLLILNVEQFLSMGGRLEINGQPLELGFYLIRKSALIDIFLDQLPKERKCTTIIPRHRVPRPVSLQYCMFSYTRDSKFGASVPTNAHGLLCSFEDMQHYYNHSPTKNRCFALPISTFNCPDSLLNSLAKNHYNLVTIRYFVNDLKFRFITTDGPNCFAVTSFEHDSGMDWMHICWYCYYVNEEESKTATMWYQYKTARNVLLSSI